MNIKSLLHPKKSHKSAFSSEHVSWRERVGEDAYVGWVIIFSISLAIALILMAYAAWLFYLIETGGIAPAQAIDVPGSHTAFDENSLDSLISSFSSKASTASALTHGFNGPPDPSL